MTSEEKGSDELLAEAGATEADVMRQADAAQDALEDEEDRVQKTTPAEHEPGEDYPAPTPPEDDGTTGYDPVPPTALGS